MGECEWISVWREPPAGVDPSVWSNFYARVKFLNLIPNVLTLSDEWLKLTWLLCTERKHSLLDCTEPSFLLIVTSSTYYLDLLVSRLLSCLALVSLYSHSLTLRVTLIFRQWNSFTSNYIVLASDFMQLLLLLDSLSLVCELHFLPSLHSRERERELCELSFESLTFRIRVYDSSFIVFFRVHLQTIIQCAHLTRSVAVKRSRLIQPLSLFTRCFVSLSLSLIFNSCTLSHRGERGWFQCSTNHWSKLPHSFCGYKYLFSSFLDGLSLSPSLWSLHFPL